MLELFNEGNAAFQEKNYQNAAEFYESIVSIDKDHVGARVRLFCSYFKGSERERAIEVIKKILKVWRHEFDRITDFACAKAAAYARAGVDILSLGDDIGTQQTIMIDVGMWEQWLKPRLSRVIETARAINPDVLIFYHSCGYIIPLITAIN